MLPENSCFDPKCPKIYSTPSFRKIEITVNILPHYAFYNLNSVANTLANITSTQLNDPATNNFVGGLAALSAAAVAAKREHTMNNSSSGSQSSSNNLVGNGVSALLGGSTPPINNDNGGGGGVGVGNNNNNQNDQNAQNALTQAINQQKFTNSK